MIPPDRRDRDAQRKDALAVHFDLGRRCYEAGDLTGVQQHRAATGLLPEGGPQSREFLALRWRECWLLDDTANALAFAGDALADHPEDADAALDLGDILMDLGRAQEAMEVYNAAAEAHADDPDLWYEAAVAAERARNWDVQLAAFRRVWEIEHAREPAWRLWLPEERFIEVAEQTIARLPPMARDALGNVVILVEDYPGFWILEGDPPDPRLLGLFTGPERAQERGLDHVAWGPAVIHLFRWNIERICSSPEEAEHQVEITVRHEIGHYLGLAEEDLHAMGLG